MPNFEPVVLDGHSYQLRLVGPRSAVWPQSLAADVIVLAQAQMVARPLPQAAIPNSPDFVSGSWTGRLLDAGEFQLAFPNKEASDGLPWRNRFDPTGHNQWIEIYYDGYLEFVGCIEKLELKRDQIVVSGHDAAFLLKKAYERDWTVIQAPRDVIERGTQVWLPVTVDNWPSPGDGVAKTSGTITTPNGSWTVASSAGGTATWLTSGRLKFFNGIVSVASPTVSIGATGAWSVSLSLASPSGTTNSCVITVTESSGDAYALSWLPAGTGFQANVTINGLGPYVSSSAPAAPGSMRLESDGEWISAYVGGQLVGYFRRKSVTTTSLQVKLATGPGGVDTVVLGDVFVEALQPFLQRGSHKGDYVLPGSASTYPAGGLHARYSTRDRTELPSVPWPAERVSYQGRR